MANGQPDFSVKTPAVDPTAIASLMQNKVVQEEQMRINKAQERRARINDILSAVQQGQQIAANAMSMADAKNKRQGAEMLKGILGEPKQTDVVGTKPAPALPSGVSGPMEAPQPMTFGETERGRSQESRTLQALLQGNPEDFMKHKTKSMFPELSPNKLTYATRSTPMALELPDGSQSLGYYDPTDKTYYLQDNTPAPPGSKRSYKYDIRPDSAGNLQVISGASGKTVGGLSTKAGAIQEKEMGKTKQLNQLPIKTRMEVQSDIAEIKRNPDFKEELKKTFQATRMHDMLVARNFVFDQKIGLQMARTMGDAGNISVVEQTEGKENKQLFYKGKQLLETYIKSGKLTEENRQAIIDAVKVMDKAAKKNLSQVIKIEEERMNTLYPELDTQFIRNSLVGKSLSGKLISIDEEDKLSTNSQANPFNINMNAIDAELKRRGLK